MNQDWTISMQSGAAEISQGADTISQMGGETIAGVPGQRRSRYFNTKIPMLRRSISAFASRQELCCRACAARLALLIKRKSSITPQSCYIDQRYESVDPDKGHIIAGLSDGRAVNVVKGWRWTRFLPAH